VSVYPSESLGYPPLLHALAQAIFDRKGKNILGLDVRGASTLTDYVLIAEGHVDRHVISMAEAVLEELRKHGIQPLCIEGLKVGDWVAIDIGDLIIHLFMPGLRDKYQLEQLWTEGKIIDLDIALPPNPKRAKM
jgi:ribosome-associated protein